MLTSSQRTATHCNTLQHTTTRFIQRGCVAPKTASLSLPRPCLPSLALPGTCSCPCSCSRSRSCSRSLPVSVFASLYPSVCHSLSISLSLPPSLFLPLSLSPRHPSPKDTQSPDPTCLLAATELASRVFWKRHTKQLL